VLTRNRARPIGFAAAALLVCVAVISCGRHQSPSSGSSYSPTATSSAETSGASFGEFDTSAPDSSGSDPASASDSSGPDGPPTPDPVASELDQINQLINDINNSISDSSSQGGE